MTTQSDQACVYRFRTTDEYTVRAVKRGLQVPVELLHRPSWFIRWVCGPFLLLVLVGVCLATIADWRKSGEIPSFKQWFAGICIFLLFLAVCWPNLLRNHKWMLFVGKPRSSPHHDREFQARVSISGIELEDSISRTVSTWECYTRAKFFADGILLESGPALFTWLPDAALVDSHRADAEAIVRSHVAHCFVMRATE